MSWNQNFCIKQSIDVKESARLVHKIASDGIFEQRDGPENFVVQSRPRHLCKLPHVGKDNVTQSL